MLETDLALCEQGKYCGAGINEVGVNPLTCDLGKKCPEGSLEQIPCDSGTYQDTQGQSDCNACEAGSYCPY